MSAAAHARWQFAVRDLLAWTWCAGAVAAAARHGLPLLAAFGIPLSIVGYQAIARSKAWSWPGWRVVGRRFWAPAACGGLLAVVLARGVWPLDSAGGMALAGGVLWSVVLATAERRAWRALAPAPIVGFAYLLACAVWPLQMERFVRGVPGSVALQDVRGGRNGVRLLDVFSYSWPGANTSLVERYLGPTEPEWEGQWYISRGYSGLEERVNRRSIIRRADLPAILALLPSDAARRQALACVTTPKNLARVHQGMLLVSLARFGFPPGVDAARWWRRHERQFRVIEDPDAASKLVFGWRQAVEQRAAAAARGRPSSPDDAIGQQLDAAYHQELGMWGGDGDFADAYYLTTISERPPADAESAP